MVITEVDLGKVNVAEFQKQFADCVVLTHDDKILLQHRPLNWRSRPGWLTTFGGHVESGETVIEALLRELHEELGAVALKEDVVALGAITEDWTNHSELVHVHFWHDRHNTITGCYEAEARTYQTIQDVSHHPKVMDYVIWALQACRDRGLL